MTAKSGTKTTTENTHKNPPEFWGMDDKWAVARGLAPLCPLSYCTSCDGCLYQHECDNSEYQGKDPNKTFIQVEKPGGSLGWEEVTKE